MDGEQVACFLDVENIRYSLNGLGYELSPEEVARKAFQYGTLSVALAYADFGQHPEMIHRGLTLAGFNLVYVPVKQRNGGGITKSSADAHMVMGIMDTVLDQVQIGTFVLMTGDLDFVPVATRLKNRFGKKVIVAGVPGSTSPDLEASASISDPFPVHERDLRPILIKTIADLKVPRSGIWSFKYIETGVRFSAARLAIIEDRIPVLLGILKDQGILATKMTVAPDEREVMETYLNLEHILVKEVLEKVRV